MSSRNMYSSRPDEDVDRLPLPTSIRGGNRRSMQRQMSEHSLHSQRSDEQHMSIDGVAAGLHSDDEDSADIIEEDAPVIDPLTSAIDAMEDKVVATLDAFKLYSAKVGGGRSSVHDDLRELLRPVLEISSHAGPAAARAHFQFHPSGSVDEAVNEIYARINMNLVLPVMLEAAQSDTVAAKRGAALHFFQSLHKECVRPGSYLDRTTGPQTGPTGPGGAAPTPGGQERSVAKQKYSAALRIQMSARAKVKAAREAEFLRYWCEASMGCVVVGSFTDDDKDDAVASRGVLAANAAIRPALKSIGGSIAEADDAGAVDLYGPVMRMMDGVLNRLFVGGAGGAGGGDAVRSACVKFLESVVMCFTSRGPKTMQGIRQRRTINMDDFALEDLPEGHPTITREKLESIGEFAFTTLRGLTKFGGQVKIDTSLLPAGIMFPGSNVDDPSSQLIAILKAAALAFLEMESSIDAQLDQGRERSELDIRQNIDMDFCLSQKSYALTINAVSIAAINRPACFKGGATALAHRCMDPPKHSDDGLTRAGALAVTSQLKASCLTLLRNPLSVTVGGAEVLQPALNASSMEAQAEKALAAAQQQVALKTAGRAARNRAALFYEWDKGEADRQSKRQRETDDALAQMRAAKVARGLGHGIHLPSNIVDACELIILNLRHLPENRPSIPSTSKASRKRPVTLDFIVDAINSNGASLSCDESRWYDRDGGFAWAVDIRNDFDNGKRAVRVTLDPKTVSACRDPVAQKESRADRKECERFRHQCESAASDAFARIVASSKRCTYWHSDLGNQIAAKLAVTLRGVKPPPRGELHDSLKYVLDSVPLLEKANGEIRETESKEVLCDNGDNKKYPLVSACLALDMVAKSSSADTNAASVGGDLSGSNADMPSSALVTRVLNEAYMQNYVERARTPALNANKYHQAFNFFVSSVARACERTNEKPSDSDRKQVATQSASRLSNAIALLPALTPSSLVLASALCNIEPVSKVAADAARKGSHHNLAASAKAHAAKAAAEKRATVALLALRDVAFQRSKEHVRKSAVNCAVGIAAGRLRSTSQVQDKALKLVMNVLFPKSQALADIVVASTTEELTRATNYAIDNHEKVEKANTEVLAEGGHVAQMASTNPLHPLSDAERIVMDRVKKPAVLFMALCVRRPEMIKSLLVNSCRNGADVLSKAVRSNMPKFARAAATKYGAATIALKIADMADDSEIPMLLAFLDNLGMDASLSSQELVDACCEIQEKKLDYNGKKDPRFIIPVSSVMKREQLVQKLPEFVGATDKVYKAALRRMSERARQALLFREEPDKDVSSLTGMTLCEELVYLHWLDFSAVGLKQKRYLDAIRLCLDDEDVFTDRVVMAALDYISDKFLSSNEGLPLAYMRTIILTCSKHERLHGWICQVLLPRLVEGKVYTDRRQWEGWMRCAKMLEHPGETGISSIDAINTLPEEQLKMYRARNPLRL